MRVQVYDSGGRFYGVHGVTRGELHLEGLPKGVYTLQLIDEQSGAFRGVQQVVKY